ncbi:MAG: hypothetical protein OXI55_04045 [Gammaproteobacteria bacterium]|nr:hypothetical protein [Gammaproteobacteria bacterium]
MGHSLAVRVPAVVVETLGVAEGIEAESGAAPECGYGWVWM